VKALKTILHEPCLAKHEALRLRGRLQFAARQVFGRVAKASLSAITAHAYRGGPTRLTERSLLAFALHVRLLESWKTEGTKATCNNVWFIQTDACYEPGDASIFSGIGAVLFTPADEPVKYFSQQLSQKHLGLLNLLKKKTAIYECVFGTVLCISGLGSRALERCSHIHGQQCSPRCAYFVLHL
jgi:hypothetical protein